MKNKKVLLFLFLFWSLYLPSFALYVDEKSAYGLSVRCEGAYVEKIKKNILILRVISPLVSINIKGVGNRKVKVKIKNISSVKYVFYVDGKVREPVQKGRNWVLFEVSSCNIKIKPFLEDPNQFTFAILGDSRGNYKIHKKILEEIEKSNAIFAISTGDIVHRGYRWEYINFLRETSSFSLPYFIVIGNHEINSRSGRRNFRKYIGPYNYSFNLGKFNFIMLDDSRGRISSDGYRFLTSQLKQHRNNFVFMHIPPLCPVAGFDNHLMYSKREMEFFKKLMARYKVRGVFCGHVHGFAYTKQGDVLYMISACAGAFPYMLPHKGGYFHYVLIHVDGDKFTWSVHKL